MSKGKSKDVKVFEDFYKGRRQIVDRYHEKIGIRECARREGVTERTMREWCKKRRQQMAHCSSDRNIRIKNNEIVSVTSTIFLMKERTVRYSL